jgi:hypothetical protein
MDVKQAVTTAKTYVQDLFGGEEVSNLGLEEVEFDEAARRSKITIGFNRPWDEPRNVFGAIAQATKPSRSFKVVTITDTTGEAVSVRNRDE